MRSSWYSSLPMVTSTCGHTWSSYARSSWLRYRRLSLVYLHLCSQTSRSTKWTRSEMGRHYTHSVGEETRNMYRAPNLGQLDSLLIYLMVANGHQSELILGTRSVPLSWILLVWEIGIRYAKRRSTGSVLPSVTCLLVRLNGWIHCVSVLYIPR